jgi:A/G-specific adenine glycosylase
MTTTEPALPSPARAASLARRLLDWHRTHGRHDLPWQIGISPYRVWVSEIMLQQTQVATVIPYFERFMQRFPDLQSLAQAPEDDVLHHWTGLGYYARARNLQKAARQVWLNHGGELPHTLDALVALPGIGRSTAAAILSIAGGQRAAILDGNVRRVLSRLFAVVGDPAQSATANTLWALAERLTPAKNTGSYTQAIMDLGATLCTRGKPDCACCPWAADCRALAQGKPGDYPAPRRRREIPVRGCQMLVISNEVGELLLERRPPSGIWGGLWSFPELAPDDDPADACLRIAGQLPRKQHNGTVFRHTFSHFHLDAMPVYLQVRGAAGGVLAGDRIAWYKPGERALGLAAPVKRLIDSLATTPIDEYSPA